MNINKAQLEALAAGVLDSLGTDEKFYSPDDYTLEQRVLAGVANELVIQLKKSLQEKNGNASRDLTQSLNTSNVRRVGNGLSVAVTGESHWKYFEYGRKPGKRPPIASIEEWITEKGIRVAKGKGTQTVLERRRGMAIAIANKIAAKGTIKRFGYKGSGFIKEVINPQNIAKISEIMARAYGQKIALYVTMDDAQ